MEQSSIVLTDEFRFLFLHHEKILNFFNKGEFEGLSDIRYIIEDFKIYYLRNITNTNEFEKHPNEKEKNKFVKIVSPNSRGNKRFELDYSKSYKLNNSYSPYSIYESISLFFKIMNYTRITEETELLENVHQAIKIANLQKYVTTFSDVVIVKNGHTIFNYIFNIFGLEYQRDKNKGEFEDIIDQWQGNIINHYNGNPPFNETHFKIFRLLRNYTDHKTPKNLNYHDLKNAGTFYLYMLIFTIHITRTIIKGNHCKKHNKKCVFATDKNCKLKICLSSNEENDNCLLKCKFKGETQYYKPFKSYKDLPNINLDLTFQGAEFDTKDNIIIPTKKNYLLASGIASDSLLANELKDNKEHIEILVTALNEKVENLPEYLQNIKKKIEKDNKKIIESEELSNIIKDIKEQNAVLIKKTNEQFETLIRKKNEQFETLIRKTDKQTEALNEIINKNINEQTKDLIRKTNIQTEILIRQTDKQTEALNEITKKILLNHLKIQEVKNETKKIVKEIEKTTKEVKKSIFQKYLKDIDSLYNKFKESANNIENAKTLENVQECFNEVSLLKKDIYKKIEEVKKLTIKEKKRRIFTGVIFLCTIIIANYIYWMPFDHSYTQRIISNPDTEYEYARKLEREGLLEEAAKWYRKAINHYETIIYEKEDSFDLRISPLLTKLYLQNKGGVHNPQKALSFINRGIDYVERREVIGVYMYWQCLYGDRETLKEKLVWAKNAIPDIFESPNYAALSKAYFELTEPNLPEEKYTAANLMLNRCINSGIWREANYVGSLLYREGIKGTWELKHSLYRTHKLLEKAADGNFIMAQLALGDRLKYLRQIEKAFKYYNLAYSNGFDDHLPLLKELAKELKHFNLLDSLNKLSPKGDLFFRNVLSYDKRRLPEERLKILETSIKHFDSSKHRMNFSRLKRTYIHDYLESDKDLDSLIYHPDTLSMKEYLLGTKYALGYGKVKKNQTKADSLIQIAVKKGYVDAIYTWGRLLYERGNTLGAIKEFRKISNIDQRAVEFLTFMYQKIDKTRSLRYESILKDPTKMYRPNLLASNVSSINDYRKKVENLEKYLCSNEYIDSRNIAVYAGMLSNLYLNGGAEEEVVNFYREIACNGLLNEKGFYMLYSHSIFLYLSGKIELAKDCYINFCINYFKLNGNNGDKSEREQIVNVLWHYFPELEKNIKEILGFDFTNGISRKEGQSIIDVSALDIDLYPNEPIYKY